MSDAPTKRMPETIEEQRAYLKALTDEEIDYSDIPPITDWSCAVRVRDYPDRKSALDAARKLYAAKQKKLTAE